MIPWPRRSSELPEEVTNYLSDILNTLLSIEGLLTEQRDAADTSKGLLYEVRDTLIEKRDQK